MTPRPTRASSDKRRSGVGVGVAGDCPVGRAAPSGPDAPARDGRSRRHPACNRTGSSMRAPSTWRRPRLSRASRGQSSTHPVARTATSARHSSRSTVTVVPTCRLACSGGAGRTGVRCRADAVATGAGLTWDAPGTASEVPAVARRMRPAIAPAHRADHEPVSSASWCRRAPRTRRARFSAARAQRIPATRMARCAHVETDLAAARLTGFAGWGAISHSRPSASGTPTTRTAAFARAARPVRNAARGVLIRRPRRRGLWGGREPAGCRRPCRAGRARARSRRCTHRVSRRRRGRGRVCRYRT